MKILFVTELTPRPDFLGKYSYPWHELAMDVHSRGMDVSVLAPVRYFAPRPLWRRARSFCGPLAYSDRMQPAVARSFDPRAEQIGGVRTFILDLRLYWRKVARLCRDADLLQFSSVKDFVSCHSALGDDIFRLRYVMNPQMSCLRFRDRIAGMWHRIFDSASATIYPSEAVRRVFCGFSGDIGAKVIPYGIKPVWYHVPPSREPGPARRPISLVTACGLVKYKGLDRLLMTVAPLEHVRLTIIGEGPYRRALEKSARALFRPERIRFSGWLPADKMIPLFDESHAFVLTSPSESLGLAFLEAMARQRPIIGMEGQGVDGLFPGCANTAFLQRDFTDRQFDGKLCELLAHRPFAACACGRCLTRWDRESIADRFVSLYKGI